MSRPRVFSTLVEPLELHRFRLRDFQGEEAGIVLCVVDVVGATHTGPTWPGEVVRRSLFGWPLLGGKKHIPLLVGSCPPKVTRDISRGPRDMDESWLRFVGRY